MVLLLSGCTKQSAHDSTGLFTNLSEKHRRTLYKIMVLLQLNLRTLIWSQFPFWLKTFWVNSAKITCFYISFKLAFNKIGTLRLVLCSLAVMVRLEIDLQARGWWFYFWPVKSLLDKSCSLLFFISLQAITLNNY